MPHDMHGHLLQVGDLVMIPCKIESITMAEDFCNLTVKTIRPMPPYIEPMTLVLNAKQVTKA